MRLGTTVAARRVRAGAVTNSVPLKMVVMSFLISCRTKRYANRSSYEPHLVLFSNSRTDVARKKLCKNASTKSKSIKL